VSFMSFQMFEVSKLKPHPAHEEIYGDEPVDDLVESIRLHGVLEPLRIETDGTILSGHRRWKAVRILGFSTVPVIIEEPLSKEEEAVKLVEYNRYRVKTPRQIYNEIKILERYLRPLARQRQLAGKKVPEDLLADRREGWTDKQIAERVGKSERTVQRLRYIFDHEHHSKQTKEVVEELDEGKATIYSAEQRIRREVEGERSTARRECDLCGSFMQRGEFKYLIFHPECIEEARNRIRRGSERIGKRRRSGSNPKG